MDLPALWRAQQNATFPLSAFKLSLDGVPLVQLDARAGAILTGCLRTDGVPRPLSLEKRARLSQCRELLGRALGETALEPEARAYFERLAVLADAVLEGNPHS